MPQRTTPLSLFPTFERAVTKALAALQEEITQREQELTTLKNEAVQWQNVLQGPAKGDGPAAAPSPRVRPPKRPRLDWSAVLHDLPTRFTTKDIAQKADKPMGHVYVYVSRWVKDKKVRKVKDGYQKVSGAA
jgi:hypothetical protein